MRPRFAIHFRSLKPEGVGNAGCPVHPQPRVRKCWLKCTRVFTARSPESSGIPARNGLRLIARSPWRPGFLATIAGGLIHRLDTSVGVSGPHGFAVRISAVRQRRIRVHRIPARVRDDRETPLSSGGTGRVLYLILVSENQNIFAKGAGQGKSA